MSIRTSLLFAALLAAAAVGACPGAVAQTAPASDTAWRTWANWDADDYAVTNLQIQTAGGGRLLQHGAVRSSDAAWFRDSAARRVLVVGLATDYHRLYFIHYAAAAPPDPLIVELGLNTAGGNLASLAEARPHLPAFAAGATPLPAAVFATRHGLRLGDALDTAVALYGAPDADSAAGEYRVLEWRYAGDYFLQAAPPPGTRVARESFGHRAQVYGKEGRVVGVAFFNDVP